MTFTVIMAGRGSVRVTGSPKTPGINKQMGLLKEYGPLFIVVVIAVIAAAYISGKLKLNSYEEYYEENFDDLAQYDGHRRAA